MVKADIRRDYYADLGVGPTADTDEIKKQFRKLALKYHPDRNPGREAEFLTKFQAIQAAHEILTDPQQRMKYDTERLRAGYGKLYGPSPPRRTATSGYPAANKTQTPKPQTPRPASYQATPSSGAQKYANYAKAAPQQYERMYEQQARADAFRGFQGMKPNGWSNFDPKTGRPPPTARNMSNGNTVPTQSRGKSAYEHINARQHPDAFGRASTTRKKQGFAPGTPGGDEPMARNVSAYSNTPRPDRSSAFFDSVPAPTAKAKRTPVSSRSETPVEDVAPEFERASHRYATTGGERTYFSSAGLGRTYSMRDSSASSKARSRTNPPSPRSPAQSRHRSASPGIRHQRQSFSSSSTSSSSDADSESESDRLKFASRRRAVPKSRLQTGQHTFQGPGSGEEASTSNYFMENPPLRSQRRYRNLFDGDRPHSYHGIQDQSTDSETLQGHDSDGASFAFRAHQATRAADYTNQGNKTQYGTTQPVEEPATFNVPQHGPKSRSHDNLNKRFSASDWGDVFKPDLFAPNQINGHRRSRSRTSPMRGRPETRGDFKSPSNVTPSNDEAGIQSKPWNQSQFSADAWSQHVQSKNWMFEPAKNQQGNATATSSGRSISRAARRAAQNRQPGVSTEADEEEATILEQSSKQGSVPVVDAMEIDEELSSQPTKLQTEGPVPSQPTPPKPYSNSKGSDEETNGSAGKTSEWMNNLFNMNTLHNVAPFTSSNSGGINDMNDIFTTLPFESRPNDPNSGRRMAPQNRKMSLPQPPKRPARPAVVPIHNDPRNMALPKQSWELYERQMSAYVVEWNKFQRQMLQILAVRQLGFETGLAPRWIDASGDSLRLNTASTEEDADSTAAQTGAGESDADNDAETLVPHHPHGGYKAYFNAVDDYTRVLEHWAVAWERHRECIAQLGDIRQWIRGQRKLV